MDSGAFALAHFLRLHGVADAHPEQFKRDDAPGGMGLKEMLKGARDRGVKAYAHTTDWSRLMTARFPVIAVLTGGGNSLLLEKIVEDNVFVLRPSTDAHEPLLLTRDQFEKIWSGDILFADQDVVAPSAPVGGAVQSVGRIGTHRPEILEPGNSEDDPIAEEEARIDKSGLGALVLLLGFHGVGADAAQIKHRLGVARVGVVDMLRCAKQLGLKASVRATRWDRLATTPLPGIAPLRDGGFLILGKVGDDQVLVQHPASPQPETMTRREFEAIWDGRLVLMARRSALTELNRRFDITWFLGAIHKYRRLLVEVLAASFVLQLFALATPLFFQVVIDKVLAHHSLSTLNVLIGGLVILTLAEGLLGALENLSVHAYDQSYRRRTRRQAVPAFDGLADGLFPVASRRQFAGARARTRKHPPVPDEFGADPGGGSVLHLRLSGGDVLLFGDLDLDRSGVLSFLHRAFGRRRAVVSPPDRRKIQARLGKPGVFWSNASRASRR